MRMVLLVLIVALVAGAYILYFLVSTASHDPAVWHTDPLTAPTSTTPNDFRVAPRDQTTERVDLEAPVFAESALVMAEAWDQFVLNQPQTIRISGLPNDLFMTYVQRTKTLKVPDYISVRFIPLGETSSTVAIYSRSRYGYGDLGVNKQRVERWLASLASFVSDPA